MHRHLPDVCSHIGVFLVLLQLHSFTAIIQVTRFFASGPDDYECYPDDDNEDLCSKTGKAGSVVGCKLSKTRHRNKFWKGSWDVDDWLHRVLTPVLFQCSKG